MTAAKPKARGRRKGSEGDSREAVLVAARALFAKHGFRGTTMREVALRAGVDQALIHYFFASKEKLFGAAIAVAGPDESLRDAISGAERPGEAMLRFHLEHLFTVRHDSVAAMLRAALADPGCLPTLRAFIEENLVGDLADGLGSGDARLRSEIAGAFMVGLFVVRHMVGVEPLAGAAVDEVVRIAAPAVDAILRSADEKSTTSRR